MDAVVHFEVPYDDGDRARGFYRDVFGWHVESAPQFAYDFVQTGEQGEDGMPTGPGYIGGGMMAREGAIDRTVLTIGVEDIEDSLARVEEAGGARVRGPDAIGDMGFAAYFTDSEGNLMGLWQTAAQDG